jgi:aminopeptidase N
MTMTRLTDLFTPTQYDLSLTLERQKRTFHGTVTVKGVAHKQGEIRLNAKELTIDSVTIDGKEATFADAPQDELVITHKDITPESTHLIVIAYHAVITDGMHGLYPCYYEFEGQKKELLATQFESHHAREVFPCVDEPAAKAVYNLTLTTETGVTALSNMPIADQSEQDGKLVTTFLPSPKMSSYLLDWVVGDLQKKTAQTERGVEVSVWSTPAQPIKALDFALDIAVRSIEFYESYFATEYPLPKSDHVALPDFTSGAMENWGLITYREIALLADPKTTSISSKQYIATVVAHELAHQWFGNLVTMKWWNDLWLNESFATLMEYLAVDALEPSWNMWLDFSTGENILALRRDAIDGVQSVQIDVDTPDEINTIFDGAIVYAKGARLLRMLQHYVGTDDFQAALKTYFAAHAYQNTEAADLWRAIDQTSGKDISGFMTAWLSQPGYPVVHASLKDSELTLEQEQFFVGPHESSDRLWPIPLDAAGLPELFDTKTLSVPYTKPQVLLNVGNSAHFITHYDKPLLDSLLAQVKDGSLSPLNRLQLLQEATLLAQGGILPSAQLIDIVKAYKDETSEPVWSMLFLALAELRKFVETDEAAEKKLRQLSGELAAPLYQKLSWEPKVDEDEADTKLRATILSLTLYSENPEALKKASNLYDSTPLEDLDPELRSLIISTVSRYGDGAIVDSLVEVYKTTSSSDLQLDIAVGVTSTRVPEKIEQLLASIKDPSIIRPQDTSRWYAYLVRGRESRLTAWQWLQNNWDWLEKTFAGDKNYDYFPRYTASALNTSELLKEYQTFFEPKKSNQALTRVITMGISEIEGRVALIERDGEAVRKALLEQ